MLKIRLYVMSICLFLRYVTCLLSNFSLISQFSCLKTCKMVENDKSTKCTKFGKIDQNDDYVSMWCGRRYGFFTTLVQNNPQNQTFVKNRKCYFMPPERNHNNLKYFSIAYVVSFLLYVILDWKQMPQICTQSQKIFA